MKKLLFFWNELKATFWFIPVLIIIFSVGLAVLLVYVDEAVAISQDGLGRFFFVNSADSARSILSTISGAMIGVAGTVFSVTLVALTLASSQFGPRLIKNFMYVRLNQVVLGSYISTYLYCLLVLNTIKDNDSFIFVPSLSILVAIIAAMVNIVLLIVFIHQIAVSIQADKVISDILDLMIGQAETLFPEKIGEGAPQERAVVEEDIKSAYTTTLSLRVEGNGYLQYIDHDGLLDYSTNQDSLLELSCRPGFYLVSGLEVGKLYTNTEVEEGVEETLLTHFVLGKTRTFQQDLEFSIHQMVEIACRALSPGINDPYTAIACIDNLTATLAKLAQRKFPSRYRFDQEEKLRIIAEVLSFEGTLGAAFNQIRQFSTGNIAVIIRLMEALITIHQLVTTAEQKQVVIQHAQLVLNTGKNSIQEQLDLDDLLERAQKIIPHEK